MQRTIKWLFWIFVLCLWTSGSYAAESKVKNPQANPPQAAAPQEAPSIQMPEVVFDFGEIMEGVEVTHQFPVKNTGSRALQIDQVRPG